jgi:sugar phosphate isomerase/epimerase
MTTCKKDPLHRILFALILFVFVLCINSCTPQKPKKNIGLQLWSVRDAMKADPKGTIEKVGKMGYSFVETAWLGYADGKFYGMKPAVFKALVNSNRLVLLSSHVGIWLSDTVSMEKTMAWWDNCIADCKAAGVKYIVQPNMDKSAFERLDVLKSYCDYFNAVGAKCNANGIRFGFHNHDREFSKIDSVTIYDFMLQNTDPVKVMFQLDLFGMKQGGKNPVDYFNKYPGRFELWHLKDETEMSSAGSMDFKPAFEMADKAGMKNFYVDLEGHSLPPLESIKKCLEFLNNAEYIK